MKQALPALVYEDLTPTRDYLREVALILGSLQRAFLPKDPHDWQHGLQVNLRGLITQPFVMNGEASQASLDLVRRKLRLNGSSWPLQDYQAQELFNNVRAWLEAHSIQAKLAQPNFNSSAKHFNEQQSDLFAEALWWMDKQFNWLKTSLQGGLSSPIFLYPHHFDLSLVWFPYEDDRQLAIGFSTGDETIAEPYLYLTAYPEPAGFTKLRLPKQAYFQTAGFSGAILSYDKLQTSDDPAAVFRNYANLLHQARPLFG